MGICTDSSAPQPRVRQGSRPATVCIAVEDDQTARRQGDGCLGSGHQRLGCCLFPRRDYFSLQCQVLLLLGEIFLHKGRSFI